jgi:hypothetical protein
LFGKVTGVVPDFEWPRKKDLKKMHPNLPMQASSIMLKRNSIDPSYIGGI